MTSDNENIRIRDIMVFEDCGVLFLGSRLLTET